MVRNYKGQNKSFTEKRIKVNYLKINAMKYQIVTLKRVYSMKSLFNIITGPCVKRILIVYLKLYKKSITIYIYI